MMLMARITIAAAFLLTTSAFGQSIFYGQVDDQQADAIAQWAADYWIRADTGQAVPQAGTSLQGALDNPLFNPLRATRATLEAVGQFDPGGCDKLSDPVVVAQTSDADTFRDAMVSRRITTDSAVDPEGQVVHAQLIADAPEGTVTWWTEGTQLISVGLPLLSVSEPLQQAAYAQQVAQETDTMIAALIESAPAIARASEGVTLARGLVTGEQDQQKRFENGVDQLLADLGSIATTIRLEAVFGVYGSLPLLAVTFDDAYVLLDATSGALDGPFALDTPLSAQELLAAHEEYAAGTGVSFLDPAGCKIAAPPRWHVNPPCNQPGCMAIKPACPTCPNIQPPKQSQGPDPAPGTSWPGTYNKNRPGWWDANCAQQGSICNCSEISLEIDTDPPIIQLVHVRNACQCPSSVGCPPPGQPSQTSGCQCQKWYFY